MLGSTGAGPVGFVVPPGVEGLTDVGVTVDGGGLAAINNDNNNIDNEIYMSTWVFENGLIQVILLRDYGALQSRQSPISKLTT